MWQTWRWFGPKDLASVDDMMQAGVEGVVSALHHVPTGLLWTAEEIAARQEMIATMKDGTSSSLRWDAVESLPVSEDIQKQKGRLPRADRDLERQHDQSLPRGDRGHLLSLYAGVGRDAHRSCMAVDQWRAMHAV